MSLKYGKREVSKVASVLDGEYETAEQAAEACLKAMEEIFAARAKFVVVAQLASDRESGTIPPTDSKAIRVSLGWYSTEGDARSAAESMWQSLQTGETFRVWVLPVFHLSPAEFGKQRKQTESVEAKMRQKRDEDLAAAYAKLSASGSQET